MRYVALLRGINVGGNNLIKMTALKACFEKQGFDDVATFIDLTAQLADGGAEYRVQINDNAANGRIETWLHATPSTRWGWANAHRQ